MLCIRIDTLLPLDEVSAQRRLEKCRYDGCASRWMSLRDVHRFVNCYLSCWGVHAFGPSLRMREVQFGPDLLSSFSDETFFCAGVRGGQRFALLPVCVRHHSYLEERGAAEGVI